MRGNRKRCAAVLLGVATMAVTLSACDDDTGRRQLMQYAVEDGVAEAVTDQDGREPDEARCAGDLILETGETQDCAIRRGTDWYPVAVTFHPDDGQSNLTARVGTEKIAEPDWQPSCNPDESRC